MGGADKEGVKMVDRTQIGADVATELETVVDEIEAILEFDDEFRHQDDDFRHRPGLPNFRHSVYVQFFLSVLGQQLVVVCNPHQGLA
jgi:hypothetical protein